MRIEYTQITLGERKAIFMAKMKGFSTKEIAQMLDRHISTIYREINRNSEEDVGYLPDTAHNKALDRSGHSIKKLDKYPALKKLIADKLMKGWSPEMIAGRLKFETFPVRVCTETIYQFVYSEEGKARALPCFLVQRKSERNTLKGRKPRNLVIKSRVSIHERPLYVQDREEAGHYEGDLIFGSGRSSNLAVVVERKTRFTMLVPNKSKKSDMVIKGIFNTLAAVPADMRKSISFDNGSEFARHELLKSIGINTYFCDAHSPWQKGQVEKTNSILRRYISKKTNLKEYSDAEIAQIQDKLNNLPRKCLNFRTPRELFNEQSVAF